MTKSELRTEFLAQRRELSVEEVDRRSACIANELDEYLDIIRSRILPKLNSSPDEEMIVMHSFLPIQQRNEVNTWRIIKRLWNALPPVQVAIAVINPSDNRLSHYRLTPDTPLREGRWHIPEPFGNQLSAIDSQQIDSVLVPLLAFDRQGHRVGYGGGYYDRFLAECRPDCVKIGLSLFEPVERIDDIEPTDVRLDGCITPERTYFF